MAVAMPAAAEIVVLDSFDPTQVGGLCALGVDPLNGNVWVYQCSGGTVAGFTPAGEFLRSFPRPGESADDVDIEFSPTEMTFADTVIPAGTLLFINGESGVAEIYAVDTASGTVLATLATAFGVSHVVGGGYHADRGTFFLVQDRVPGNQNANRVAEVDPVSGAVLDSFGIGNDFVVNYGDLDVSAATGHLFVASSVEASLGEFTPVGAFVTAHPLPGTVASLSGLGLECGLREAWVAGTAGRIWRLGEVDCGSSPTAVGDEASTRFFLQPNRPDPFTGQTSIGYTLPRAARVRLEVYDLRGRRVRTLVDEAMPAGTHAAVWNGADDVGRRLPSGAYVYHLSTGGVTLTQRAVLLR